MPVLELPSFGEPKDKSFDADSEEEEESEPEEELDEAESETGFGLLQALFQPYFPEWQKVYTRPKRQASLGAHIFKVTLVGWRGNPGIWRRLAVPPTNTLDDLAIAILGAFRFDDDHLYDFHYRDQRGIDITVGESELALKDAMLFTFDYGDDWKFEVRLGQIETKPCRLKAPKVIAKAGKAPKQYQSEW